MSTRLTTFQAAVLSAVLLGCTVQPEQGGLDVGLVFEEPAIHQADGQKGARAKEPTSIWCLPGCRLENDDNGKPITPSWCKRWQPASPLCRRDDLYRDMKDFCLGDWAGVGAFIDTSPYQRGADKLTSKPELDRPDTPAELMRNVHYNCVEIDLDQLNLESALPINCRPGCTVEGSPLDIQNLYQSRPDWCAAVTNGNNACASEDCYDGDETVFVAAHDSLCISLTPDQKQQ